MAAKRVTANKTKCRHHPHICSSLTHIHTFPQVTAEIEEMRFNTGISAMMEFINGVTKVGAGCWGMIQVSLGHMWA